MDNFRTMLRIAIIGLILFLSACIGEDFIEVDPTQRPRVVIYGPTTSLDSVLVGESVQYSAAYFNEYGLIDDGNISWSSLNTAIARVNSNGRVEGITNGITQIVATSNGQSARQALQVYSIERVEVNTPKTYLFLGDSLQLSATYFDENNLIQNASFSWNSVAPSVASISSSGLLKGLLKGQTIVTASANGQTSMPILFNVIDDSSGVATVVIIKDTTKINVGDVFQFEAEVRNGFGDPVSSNITWSSSDNSVLSISSTGLATALLQGTSNVMASAEGVNSAASQVVVLEGANGRRSGSFQDENGYNVSGNVEMRPGPGNNFELHFTNFNCQPGPDLYIYLGNSTTSGIEITELTQLTGSFTQQLPGNIQLNDYNYVLIWCRSANAAFGSALLN